MDEYLKEILRVSKAVPVFPVKLIPKKLKNGAVKMRKIPACPNGFKDATHDEAQIRMWWNEHPTAAVGMPTGRASGLWVLDLDVKENVNGADHFKDKKLPKTISQSTVSGGQHLFFNHSYKHKFKSSTDVLGLRCVDTRTNGGYVVISPSKGYTMDGDLAGVAADAPDWLVDALNDSYSAKANPSPVPSGRAFGEVEVNKLLRDCPIQSYRDRSSWLQIIMAVKSGTEGADYGLEALHEWSNQEGEDYDSDTLDREWASIDITREGGITGRTLIHQAKVHRIEKTVMEDFDDGFLEVQGNDVWEYKANLLDSSDANAMNLLTEPQIIVREGMDPAPNPFHNLIVFDELKQAFVFTRRPPSRWGADKRINYTGRRVNLDTDLTEFRVLVNTKYGTKFNMAKFDKTILAAAMRNMCNPVTGYLGSLKWDGVKRLDEWLIKYAGAEDTPYTRFVSRKTLIGGVARAYKPGCKLDNMLILESRQGVGKSTIVSILGGEWAGVPTISMGDKDAEQNLQGLWIAEWSELANMRKKDAAQLKDFVSKAVATFRGSYGKSAMDFPRRCIIIGTHNPEIGGQYLTDSTGNRRYWPVSIEGVIDHPIGKKVDFEGLKAARDQIWAEAVAAFNDGEYWAAMGEEDVLAEEAQKERTVEDPWAEIIVQAVTQGALSSEARIPMLDIYDVLSLPAERITVHHKQRIRQVFAEYLKDFEWKRCRVDGALTYAFERKNWK